LSYWRDIWFGWLIRSTQIVVIGLVLEGPELVHELLAIIRHRFRAALPEVHTPDWVKLVAFIGWILIVAGVAGEWVTSVLVSQADANLQTFNNVLLAETNRAAGNAKASAEIADWAASRARDQSDKATASASNALALADSARKEADSFEKDIVSAKKQAADAESHLADALQRAANAEREVADATRELVRLKTPRSLNDEQQGRIISKIKPFPGIPFDLWVNTDSDSTAFMYLIDSMLRSAGWKFNKPSGTAFAFILFADKAGVIASSGISIHVAEEHLHEWGPACVALRDALAAEGIPVIVAEDTPEGERDKQRDRIHVMIGSKPLN
jgi:hypothetical protein